MVGAKDNRGGYQKPRNPAPSSGPGGLSRRTDGGPGDEDLLKGGGKYGESKALAEFQAGAPSQPQDAGPVLNPALNSPAMGSFDAETSRPDEPVTAGADAGAGPGMDALGLLDTDDEDVRAILPMLPDLEWLANRPNAMPSTRAAVRALKARL